MEDNISNTSPTSNLLAVKDESGQNQVYIYSWRDKVKNKLAMLNLVNNCWLKLILMCYITFSFILASFHAALWLLPREDELKLARTYDPDATYSALDSISFDLKMSKMLSKSDFNSIDGIIPYWKKSAVPIIDEQDITLVTVVYTETWGEFINLVESWKGPVSAVLHINNQTQQESILKIENDYSQISILYDNVNIHLVKVAYASPLLVPENAERNLARLYSNTQHILDATTNIIFSLDLRTRLLENKMQYADMMARGDMLVVPTFKVNNSTTKNFNFIFKKVMETTEKKDLLDLLEKDNIGLYDPNFDLNNGPTNLKLWKSSHKMYRVDSYAMHYEPIVIQSKTVQPWCSERFINKRSICYLGNFLAGSDFKVLENGWAIYKNKESKVSDLDSVIERKIRVYFLMEQCIYYSRQIDALGLWKTKQSFNIKELCSSYLKKWGEKMIKNFK